MVREPSPLVKIRLVVLNILRGNQTLTQIKIHNSVTNLRKLTCYNPSLELANINAYANLGQNPTELKHKSRTITLSKSAEN